MARVKPLLLLGLFVIMVVFGYQMAGNRENPRKTLPAARFFDSSGAETGLEALRGKVVLVNLWATWCTPCIAELPTLQWLQAEFGGQGLQVQLVSLDGAKGPAAVSIFLQQLQVTGLASWHDKNRAVVGQWRYEGVPTSILLDRKGGIIRVFQGPYEWDKGEPLAAIRAALAER